MAYVVPSCDQILLDTFKGFKDGLAKFVCPLSGSYLVGGHIEFSRNPCGSRQFMVRVNNVAAFLELEYAPAPDKIFELFGSTVVRCVAGDVIDVVGYQDCSAGTTLTINADVWIVRVGW